MEDIAPLKMVGDGLIKHFSHQEHNLRLIKDGDVWDENIPC